jgi:iron only hydrogenase large subunit-like protein
MATGCYPIQSDTSCANEWLTSNSSSIVSSGSIELISKALESALCDDRLVDEISEINLKTIDNLASIQYVRTVALDFYTRILHD